MNDDAAFTRSKFWNFGAEFRERTLTRLQSKEGGGGAGGSVDLGYRGKEGMVVKQRKR